MAPTSAVIVTGGASGIGRACAEAIAAQGRAVAVWDLNTDGALAAAQEIANKLQTTMLDSFQNSLPQKNRKNWPMRNPTGPTQHLSHRGQSAESKAKSNLPTRC